MKRLLVIFVTVFVMSMTLSAAEAQVWYPTAQGTFGWDAVTTLGDGSPIPAGSTVAYQPYVRMSSVSTPTKVGDPVTATQRTITFSEGAWLVGVAALRYDSGAVVSESEISWSDNAAVCQGGVTFGFRNWLPPAAPIGLRRIQ